MKKITLILMVLSFTSAFILNAIPGDTYTVSGKVYFPGEGNIYIQIVCEAAFNGKEGFSKGQILEVKKSDVNNKYIRFNFQDIPPGEYTIQAFQDVSGNSKMDSGLFGPSEPWGFYRECRPLFRGPEFHEVVFKVDKNIYNIEFKVE